MSTQTTIPNQQNQQNQDIELTQTSQTTQTRETLPPHYHDFILDIADQPKPPEDELPNYSPPQAGAIVGERVVGHEDFGPLVTHLDLYNPNSPYFDPDVWKAYSRGLIMIRTLLLLAGIAGMVSNLLLLTAGTNQVDIPTTAAQLANCIFTILHCSIGMVLLAVPKFFFEYGLKRPRVWLIFLACEAISFCLFLWASFSTANALTKFCQGMTPTGATYNQPGNWNTACTGAFLSRWTAWLAAVFALLSLSFSLRMWKFARQIQ